MLMANHVHLLWLVAFRTFDASQTRRQASLIVTPWISSGGFGVTGGDD
jgi:hypothetical protein